MLALQKGNLPPQHCKTEAIRHQKWLPLSVSPHSDQQEALRLRWKLRIGCLLLMSRLWRESGGAASDAVPKGICFSQWTLLTAAGSWRLERQKSRVLWEIHYHLQQVECSSLFEEAPRVARECDASIQESVLLLWKLLRLRLQSSGEAGIGVGTWMANSPSQQPSELGPRFSCSFLH